MQVGDLVCGQFGYRTDYGIIISVDFVNTIGPVAKHYDILWTDQSDTMKYHEDTVKGYVKLINASR